MAKTRSGLPPHPHETFAATVPAAPRAGRQPPRLQAWTVAAAGQQPETVDALAGRDGQREPNPTRSDDGIAYRLLRQIGRGGAGEVWEAEQTSLGRIVAVKRLRRDIDTDGSRPGELGAEAEFRGESVIAAGLEHPNILPVYDLGCDREGSLLLAMKRVHGRPWNEQLRSDRAELPPEIYLERHLPILIAVTQAVAFAHSRGIVHRDIKPAQVLVGAFGEVLLTDWGLALEVGQDDGRPRLLSALGNPTPATASSPAGTPALMAPEQTEASADHVGPWTDVYLLGGTLYYLLTGSYPHAAPTSTEALEHARRGQVEPPTARAPQGLIPPELERLCLAALEPDPERRLGSASAFLEGLESYLSGAARRQKSNDCTADVASRLAAADLDYAGYNAALATLDEARRLWPGNPEIDSLRERALHGSARLALDRGDLALARLQNDAMPPSESADVLRGAIARRQQEVDRRRLLLRLTTAAVGGLLLVIAAGALVFSSRMRAANAEIALRAEEAERALAIAQARGAGAFELIDFVLADLKSAMDEELTPERGITAEVRNTIAHGIAGKVASPIVRYFEQAEVEAWPESLQLEQAEQMLKSGDQFRELARDEEARTLLELALGLRESLLGPEDVGVAEVLSSLSRVHEQAGRFAEAEPLFRRALTIAEARLGPDHPEVGQLVNRLASFHVSSQQLDEAEPLYRRAIAIFEKHHDPDLAEALTNLGTLLNRLDRPQEAEPLIRQALASWEARPGPDQSGTAFILDSLAASLRAQQRYEEAEPLLDRAIAIFETTLGPNHPQVAITLSNRAALARGVDDLDLAEALERRALAILEVAYGPDHFRVGRRWLGLGYVLYDRKKYPETVDAMRRATEIFEAAFGPKHLEIGWTLSFEGYALEQMNRLPEAKAVLERAVALLVVARGPDHRETLAAKAALDSVERKLAASNR